MKYSLFVSLALALSVSAMPGSKRAASAADQAANANDAKALNAKFATLTGTEACKVGEQACIKEGFAQCVGDKFVVQGCAPGTKCAALPLVNARGTSIACTTQADIDARFAAALPDAGAAATTAAPPPPAATSAAAPPPAAGTAAPPAAPPAANDGGDLQKSLNLDPALVVKAFAQDGKPVAPLVASQVSTNNFINFCALTPNLPLSNGNQIKTGPGSCNPAPMGVIAGSANMPSAKFVFPPNGDTSLKTNQTFTIQVAVNHLDVGNFVNADFNYFSAPQQTNDQGDVIGHTHVVAQLLKSIDDPTPLTPNKFSFFKGVNTEKGADGLLTAVVTGGLPAGAYRLSTINAAANHQPVLVSEAQHGLLDDIVYFTVNP